MTDAENKSASSSIGRAGGTRGSGGGGGGHPGKFLTGAGDALSNPPLVPPPPCTLSPAPTVAFRRRSSERWS